MLLQSSPMRLTVVLTPDERLRMQAAVLKKRTQPRNYSDAYLIALYFLIGVVAYVATPTTWSISVGLVVLGVMFGVWMLRAEARRRTRKLAADDPHALEPYEIDINETGVRTWCAHIDCRMTWDWFTQVSESPEFYLFLRRAVGYAVPKRLLDDSSDAEMLRLIREYSPDHGAHLARELSNRPGQYSSAT